MNADDFTLAIRTGAWDSELEAIERSIRVRRAKIAQSTIETLTRDDIFLLTRIKPLMLEGLPVKFIDRQGDKIRVEMMASKGTKWRRGSIVTIKPVMVGEKIA